MITGQVHLVELTRVEVITDDINIILFRGFDNFKSTMVPGFVDNMYDNFSKSTGTCVTKSQTKKDSETS